MSDTRYDVIVATKQNSLSLKNRNITALAGGMSGGRGGGGNVELSIIFNSYWIIRE